LKAKLPEGDVRRVVVELVGVPEKDRAAFLAERGLTEAQVKAARRRMRYAIEELR
jgi:hypothetical protein